MNLEIDVVSGREIRRIRVERDRATIGQASANEVALSNDAAASQLHAVLERFAAGWCITDLGSSNGTWVNNSRVFSPQRVRDGDEIRIGNSRLLIHDPAAAAQGRTDIQAEAPAVTSRERDVLVALCRPLLARDMFTEPSSTRAIAEELVITQAAVKQHLSNLYGKFGITAEDSNRRLRLANEALRCGAVSMTDLHGTVVD